jgi:hypothetical protein
MSISYGNLLGPVMPVLLMLGIVVANHVIAGNRSDKKAASESLRFSAALLAELGAMLDLYKINLDLIDKKANYLLSTRTMIAIYKSNLGRLTVLLEDGVIRDIVDAFAENERMESQVAAHSNLKCNLTYQFSPADVNFDEWNRMYRRAAQRIIQACKKLEHGTGPIDAISAYSQIGSLSWAVAK